MFLYICTLPRPHGKFLVIFEDHKEQSRFLTGRDLLLLMGFPIHRMAGLDDTADSVLSNNWSFLKT